MANVNFSGTIKIFCSNAIITVDTVANILTLNVSGDKLCEVRLNSTRMSREIMDGIVDDITHNSNFEEGKDGIDSFFELIAQIKETIQKKRRE